MTHKLPSLNALRAFEAAARLKSIRAAGAELNVTHGAISRQVKHLEEQLGVSLLVKDGRGIKLTDQGEILLKSATQSFNDLAHTCQSLKRAQEDQPFVLACSGSLLARWMIPRLDQLNRDLPELHLQLSTSQGEPDPLSLNVDATLVFGEAPWPKGLEILPISTEAIGAVVSPAYAERLGISGNIQSLLQADVLATRSRPQAWPLWCEAHGLGALNISQQFEHLYFLLEAAVAGLGVAIAPQALVTEDIKAGRLLAPWGFIATDGVLALCIGKQDPRATALAEWLRAQFRGS